MTKCLICGNEYNDIKRHIRAKHNLEYKEYYDKYIKKEDEGKCVICGKPTKFFNKYGETCSKRCTMLHRYGVTSAFALDSTKEKIRKTNLERYGVENPLKSKEIRSKLNKTCLERYGTPWHFGSEHAKQAIEEVVQERYGANNVFAVESVKETIKQRNITRRGVEYPSQSKDVLDKCVITYRERYGVDSPLQLESTRQAARDKLAERIRAFEKANDCVHAVEYQAKYRDTLREYAILTDGTHRYIPNSMLEELASYYDKFSSFRSKFEYEVFHFLRDELNISEDDIIVNTRSIIKPQELDLYLPKYNIAIECNGVYWHSRVDKHKHANKTNACEELGIRLIHINEWEWQNKRDICKSIIKSSIKQYDKKIYARKCEFREVNSKKEAKDFIEKNHIHGYVNAKFHYGLYYDDELVQIISISKSRFKSGHELYRMRTKLNTQVVGGFSKLMQHQPFDYVHSYVDRSYFIGVGYTTTGWKFVQKTVVGYAYYKDIKLSRQAAQKSKLSKLLADYDESKTESQNMSDNGWYQLYNSGNLEFVYTRSQEI